MKAKSHGGSGGGHGHGGGFPGMGGGGGHGGGEHDDGAASPGSDGGKSVSIVKHHVHGPVLEGAEDVMSDLRESMYDWVTEIVMLFNCFFLAYYVLHLGPVTFPGKLAIGHPLVLAPAIMLPVYIAPMMLKYYTLLESVLYKDNDLVAEVYHELTRMISLKNAIKKTLVQNGMEKNIADDKDMDFKAVAESLFDHINLKGEEIQYPEFKRGLREIGVYMTNQEFSLVVEFVDPDQSGSISKDEWLNFILASDDELEKDEWRDFAAAIKLRKYVQSEIMKEVLDPVALAHHRIHNDRDRDGGDDEMVEDMAVAGELRAKTVPEIIEYIFTDIDVDDDGALSYEELHTGLIKHGVEITDVDFGKIAKQMDPDGDGSISRAEWDAFLLGPEPTKEAKKRERKDGKRAARVAGKAVKAERKAAANARTDDTENPLAEEPGRGTSAADPELGGGGVGSFEREPPGS